MPECKHIIIMEEVKHYPIEPLIERCVLFFQKHCYTESRIYKYKCLWRTGILRYMKAHGTDEYTSKIGESFTITCNKHGLVRHQEREFIRSIQVLDDMLNANSIRMAWKPSIHHPLYGEIGEKMECLINHLQSLRRSRTTIKEYRLYLNGFLNHLTSKGITTMDEISEYHVMKYIGTYTGSSKLNVVSALRVLFRYWNESKAYCSDIADALSSYKMTKEEKLPSAYTETEVRQIELSINRSSGVGKRNYAMVLLATRLGLRASDIAGLTYENLDWDRNTIRLAMYKTKKDIELPLVADVGNAIIDYLKYGRRDNTSRNVFISTRAPYRAATKAMVCSAIRREIEQSGIDTQGKHHGPHSLRHSLATTLLKDNTTIPVISEVLGHRNTTTTMKYLRVDLSSLLQSALPVPPVPDSFYLQKGGLFYE